MSPAVHNVKPTCRTCIHRAPAPDLSQVECRRLPPTIFLVPPQGFATMFPQPRSDWWCSEYTEEVQVWPTT